MGTHLFSVCVCRGGRPLGLPDLPGPRIFAVFSLLAAMLLPPFSTPIISPPLPYFSYRIAAAFSFPGQLVGGLSCFRVKCSPSHRSPYWSCCTPIGGPSFLCSHFLTLPAAGHKSAPQKPCRPETPPGLWD